MGSDDNGGVFIAIMISVGLLCFIPVAYFGGREDGRSEQRKEAVKQGVGKYEFDSETGEAKFQYVLPALPADALIDNNCWVIKKKYN